jgi:hypothetical protein
VAKKIAATVTALGVDRFDLKYSAGTTGHGEMMKSIELYGTKVIPMVKDMLADKEAAGLGRLQAFVSSLHKSGN